MLIVRAALLFAFVLAASSAARAQGACPGDCNGDGMVSVNELIRGVNINLGAIDVSECEAFDTNSDGSVSISELVSAVNAALAGCDSNGTPSYAEVQAIFDLSCAFAGCHGGAVPASELDLTADVSYDALIDVVPVTQRAVELGFLLVEPFDGENSFLLRKVAGPPGEGLGDQMPRFGAPLSDEQVRTIREWIEGGALED